MMAHASDRIAIVEILRGLAALAVAWFHLTNTYEPGWVQASGAYGWTGVDVFFVISGFVIPYSISRAAPGDGRRRFTRFLARRMTRLEPPYLISILLTLALWQLSSMTPSFMGAPPQFDAGQIASHALYLVPLTGHEWLQPVYWTLAYEFLFYIVVGLAYWLIAPGRNPLYWALLAGAALALAAQSMLDPHALLFVIGISVFRLVTAPRGSMQAAAAIAVALVVIGYLWMDYRPGAVAGGLTGLAIALLCRLQISGGLARPLLWLGAISYSLYLTHVPIGGRVVNLGKRVADTQTEMLFVSLGALAVALAFAAAYHRLVEQPAIRLSRSLSLALVSARATTT